MDVPLRTMPKPKREQSSSTLIGDRVVWSDDDLTSTVRDETLLVPSATVRGVDVACVCVHE